MSASSPSTISDVDVLVVGGGVQGAALVWEAAARGLRAVLVEQRDFAAGASCNSQKIMHGGVRYVQNLDLPRILESRAELRNLLRNAPHLVSPLTCLMPTYRGLTRGRLALAAGFTLFNLATLGRNRGLPPSRRIPGGRIISKSALLARVPLVDGPDVTGGAQWTDGQALNTERLVLAFLMAAQKRGAQVRNYTRFTGPVLESGSVVGAGLIDSLTGEPWRIGTRLIISCTGAWKPAGMGSHPSPRFVKAVNLVLPRVVSPHALGVRCRALPGQPASQRLLVLTPWRDGQIIGTWYFPDEGDPASLSLKPDELQTCLADIHRALPGLDLRKEEISMFHMGLLPSQPDAPWDPGDNLLDRPVRRHAADEGGCRGLFSLTAVKYTAARSVAEKTLEWACDVMGVPLTGRCTHRIPLDGGDLGDPEEFTSACKRRYGAAIGPDRLHRLICNYGTRLHDIMARTAERPDLLEPLPGAPLTLKAEVEHILQREHVRTLADLVRRRTDLGTMACPSEATLAYCAERLAARDGVSRELFKDQIQQIREGYPPWARDDV